MMPPRLILIRKVGDIYYSGELSNTFLNGMFVNTGTTVEGNTSVTTFTQIPNNPVLITIL